MNVEIPLEAPPPLEPGHRPATFHIMLKPRGAICNLDCTYCYFLSKERLYPDSDFRMSPELLEDYTRQYIAAQQVPEVTFAWQGGEPTLMGLEYFRLAVEYQQKYRRPGMRIQNALQTNGTLLDDAWCEFLHAHDFLIGLSMDGPAELHDKYRVDKGGAPTHAKVLQAARRLRRHKVEFNILCTVHAGNAAYPLPVYRHLRDEVGAQFIQFIPIVERDNETGYQEGSALTGRSVSARQYGEFLIAVFEDWVRHDVGRIFVQIFDVALAAWTGNRPGLCIFEEKCGSALAMEHNGDLFSCDHYVEPGYLLGNIQETSLVEMAGSTLQNQFGSAKLDTLPQYCLDCEVRFVCNGGCPKNRFIKTPDGAEGLNYLCAGYRAFFNHVRQPMETMARLLAQRRAPAAIMELYAQKDRRLHATRVSRNAPCPCGSGRKFKACCGRRKQKLRRGRI